MTEEEKKKQSDELEEEDEDLDLDDLDDELDDDSDNEEDEEEENHDDGDEKPKEKSKEEQDKEERARQAKARREREAKERENREKEIEQKAYLKGKLDSTKVNTYTEEPIEDEYDLFIYETQKQLEKEGKDPIADLPKRIAEINRKKEKSVQEEVAKKKELDDRIDKEFAEFTSKYPKVGLSELLKDPDFQDYADDRLGKGGKTLTQLYESFLKLKGTSAKVEEEEEDDGKKSPPSPNGGRKREKTSYSKMSEEDKIKELRRQGLIN